MECPDLLLPRLRLDFGEERVFIGPDDKKGIPKNNLWKLLEFFILHQGEDIYCTCGFYLFPGWWPPGKPKRKPYGQFHSTVDKLRTEIIEKRYGWVHHLILHYGSSQGTWGLTPGDFFSSNLIEMRKDMIQAEKLFFEEERFDDAAKLLLGMLSEHPNYNYKDAHLLLLASAKRAKKNPLSNEEMARSARILSDENDILEQAITAAERNFTEEDKAAAKQIKKMREKRQAIENCLSLVPDNISLSPDAGLPGELQRINSLMAGCMDDSLSQIERAERFEELLALPLFKKLHGRIVTRLKEKSLFPDPGRFDYMLSKYIPYFLTRRCDSIKSLYSLVYSTVYYRWEEDIGVGRGVPRTMQRDIRRHREAGKKLHDHYGKVPDKEQIRDELRWSKEKQDEILEGDHRMRKKDLNLDGKRPYLKSASDKNNDEDEISFEDEI